MRTNESESEKERRLKVEQAARLAKKHGKTVNAVGSLGQNTEESLTSFVKRCTYEYGNEVIYQRALPDYRDGLKPVHRVVLYAMYELRLFSGARFKKCARIVGDTMGKYHPHGDLSIYDALVGIAGVKKQGTKIWASKNCATPLIEGQGNFGDYQDNAAAMRYTESRLSKFSEFALLDPQYMNVIDYVPNYDESEIQPVILPAKLPILLLNGFNGIAVGVSGSSPPFAIEGVIALTTLALKGKTITEKLCAETLVIDPPYGGTCISPMEDLIQLMSGKGRAVFVPSYVVDEKKKTITFTSVCPGLTTSKTVHKFLTQLADIDGVQRVDDASAKNTSYVVTAKKGTTDAFFRLIVSKCIELATRSESYDLGVTIRAKDGSATFAKITIPELLTSWAKWRLELELKMLDHLESVQVDKRYKLELMMIAVNNIDIIAQALKVSKNVLRKGVVLDGTIEFLVKNLHISSDDAKYILSKKLMQIRALELKSLEEQVAKCDAEIAVLQRDRAKPAQRIIKSLNAINFEHLTA